MHFVRAFLEGVPSERGGLALIVLARLISAASSPLAGAILLVKPREARGCS